MNAVTTALTCGEITAGEAATIGGPTRLSYERPAKDSSAKALIQPGGKIVL
jgi:hypothetical protein